MVADKMKLKIKEMQTSAKKNRGLAQPVPHAEPHPFYAAPAPGENFDATPAPATPAPALTLLYSKPTLLKRTKV
jgi:hypothetical protein